MWDDGVGGEQWERRNRSRQSECGIVTHKVKLSEVGTSDHEVDYTSSEDRALLKDPEGRSSPFFHVPLVGCKSDCNGKEADDESNDPRVRPRIFDTTPLEDQKNTDETAEDQCGAQPVDCEEAGSERHCLWAMLDFEEEDNDGDDNGDAEKIEVEAPPPRGPGCQCTTDDRADRPGNRQRSVNAGGKLLVSANAMNAI